MTAFDDMIAADALNGFAEFKETITYFRQGQNPLTIQAIVFRNPPDKTRATPRQLSSRIEIDIPRPSLPTRPILSGDAVQLTGDDKRLLVVSILDESDLGMWHIVVN